MPLTNYRDVSPPIGDMGAGFQFEFTCESCFETWRAPFKPYRPGQASGILYRLSSLLNEFFPIGGWTGWLMRISRISNKSTDLLIGAKAKAAALAEAQALAEQRYDKCAGCHMTVCGNCYNESTQHCVKCEVRAAEAPAAAAAVASGSSAVCPNCQTPSQGGRFCHECGFDMASTHKSCPACGSTMARQARFCTDCGHGF